MITVNDIKQKVNNTNLRSNNEYDTAEKFSLNYN